MIANKFYLRMISGTDPKCPKLYSKHDCKQILSSHD
jgi:hypothetical protein